MKKNSKNQIIKSTFNKVDVFIKKKKRIYKKFFRADSYFIKHKLFKGGVSKIINHEIFSRPSAVVVIPYDPKTDSLIMIEQIRIGALFSKNNISPWQFEFVAGMIEQKEDLFTVAKRETKEETGLNLQKIEHLMHYYVSPGGTNETLDIFLGKVDTKNAGGLFGLKNENEDIRTFVIKRKDALESLFLGKIHSATSIICLQWLALNEKKLKEF